MNTSATDEVMLASFVLLLARAEYTSINRLSAGYKYPMRRATTLTSILPAQQHNPANQLPH